MVLKHEINNAKIAIGDIKLSLLETDVRTITSAIWPN